ncbi:hypothetical protein ScPMuIL_016338 [Solemya velum]
MVSLSWSHHTEQVKTFTDLEVKIPKLLENGSTTGVIETKLSVFDNDEGKQFDGSCCDRAFLGLGSKNCLDGDPCDHSFVLCLGNVTESSSMRSCAYGRQETGAVGGNKIAFDDTVGESSNPLRFKFDNWPNRCPSLTKCEAIFAQGVLHNPTFSVLTMRMKDRLKGTCNDGCHEFDCTSPLEGRPRCEFNIDECADDAMCTRNKCLDLINDFQCECTPGFQRTLLTISPNSLLLPSKPMRSRGCLAWTPEESGGIVSR